jgi:hypothetical protein
MTTKGSEDQPVTVADLEVVSALPRPGGFILGAQGRDGATYEVDLKIDVPMNEGTRIALGEMLAQSEFRLSRLNPKPSLLAGARRIKRRVQP